MKLLPIKLLFIIIIFAVTSSLLVLVVLKRNPTTSNNPKAAFTALAAESDTITIDFSRQTAIGSPLIFGGAHAPNPDHQDAWDLLADAGVTMIRRDFWIENELPKNITLEDYKANKNEVQNSDTWDKIKINGTNSLFQDAQKRGMKVMAILSYAPGWLTYSGKQTGVPKDWEVYEDIVKKSYRLHRPYLDMIEIWNEPDIQSFLDPAGSGLSGAEAYALIFEHAVKAIKSVDAESNDGRKIPILTPAAALPNETEMIEYLLSKPTAGYIDGVSVHSYKKNEPSWDKYLTVMKKYGREKLPIYVTEWNKTGEYIKNNDYVSGEIAIPYTGKKLVQFLKYGIAGANYFSTTYFDPISPTKYTNSFGFYRRVSSKSELLPQGKTWQLLSKSLALGDGTSRIYATDQPDTVPAVGFTNFKSGKGLAIVNEATVIRTVGVSLKNLKLPKNTTAKLFIASGLNDPKAPFCTQDISSDLSDPSFSVSLPPQSVVGIIFAPPKLTLNSLLRILGVSTSRDCFINLK